MYKLPVYLLSLGHFCVDLAPGALPAVLPFLVLHNNLSYTEVAGLMFASSCLSSIVQPLFGYWADKSSNHSIMALGIAMSGIGLGLSGLATNYWLTFLAVTIMGIGTSVFHPVAARVVNHVAERKATGMGIFSVGGNIGFGIGPLAAGAVLSLWQMPGTLVFGVTGTMMALVMLWAMPKMIHTSQLAGNFKNTTNQTKEEARNDWNAFARLSLVILFRSIALTATLAFVPLFCIHRFGISEAFSTTLLTFLCFCGALMTVFGGWFTDKVGLTRACKLGYLLMAPVFACMLVVPSIWWIFPLMVVLSFTLNGTYAAFVVLGQTYLAKNIGFASGVTMGLAASLGGIFTPVLGFLADSYGIEFVIQALIVIGVLCAFFAFFLVETTPKTGK